MILAILSVHKINKAMDWQPPPWLGALEAVAIINPLAVGFSKNALKQNAVMAPIVAAVVQGSSMLQKRLASPLEDRWEIPPVVTRLGLSIGLGLIALVTYPKPL